MYECKNTFSSMTGVRFHKGETISLSQLSDLPAEERAYFRRSAGSDSDDEESDRFLNGEGVADTLIGIGTGLALSSLFGSENDDIGSSDSGSSFDGFGGGDFGGGGASGDF